MSKQSNIDNYHDFGYELSDLERFVRLYNKLADDGFKPEVLRRYFLKGGKGYLALAAYQAAAIPEARDEKWVMYSPCERDFAKTLNMFADKAAWFVQEAINYHVDDFDGLAYYDPKGAGNIFASKRDPSMILDNTPLLSFDKDYKLPVIVDCADDVMVNLGSKLILFTADKCEWLPTTGFSQLDIPSYAARNNKLFECALVLNKRKNKDGSVDYLIRKPFKGGY